MADDSPRPSRWTSAFFALVGVLMFLGFGAALVARAIESAAAPADPPHFAAEALGSAPDETWIALDGVTEPCALPTLPSGSSSAVYRVLGGPEGGVVGLVDASDGHACSDVPRALRGTTHARTVAELALPSDAADVLRRTVGERVVVVWTSDEPTLGIGEASMWGAMSMLGGCIAWFYAAAFFTRAARVRLPPRERRGTPPLLPPRPLRLARAYRASPVMGIAFFVTCAVLFGGLTVGQWPAEGSPDWTTIALMAFTGAMTLVFVLLLLVVARNAVRAPLTVQRPREAWAQVVRHDAALAKGVDVGNRALAYEDPFGTDGEEKRVIDVVIGANEALPWIVDGCVLVFRAEGDEVRHVLREDGGPFELTDDELAKIAG